MEESELNPSTSVVNQLNDMSCRVIQKVETQESESSENDDKNINESPLTKSKNKNIKQTLSLFV